MKKLLQILIAFAGVQIYGLTPTYPNIRILNPRKETAGKLVKLP